MTTQPETTWTTAHWCVMKNGQITSRHATEAAAIEAARLNGGAVQYCD